MEEYLARSQDVGSAALSGSESIIQSYESGPGTMEVHSLCKAFTLALGPLSSYLARKERMIVQNERVIYMRFAAHSLWAAPGSALLCNEDLTLLRCFGNAEV